MTKSLYLAQLILIQICIVYGPQAEVFPTILREKYKMDLSSTLEGLIFIYVQEGDHVKKGTRLFGNETKELHLKVKLATLQWQQAKSTLSKVLKPLTDQELAFEKMTFDQKEALYTAGGLSLDAFNLAKLEHELKIKKSRKEDIEIAELNVKTKKVQLQLADAALAKATFRAPLIGKINKIYIQHNEWVKPGQKVLQLIGVHPLSAVINAGLDLAGNINIGKIVNINVNLGDKTIETKGVVKFISEDVDAASQTVRIRIEIKNADRRFKPGMRAEVTLP